MNSHWMNNGPSAHGSDENAFVILIALVVLALAVWAWVKLSEVITPWWYASKRDRAAIPPVKPLEQWSWFSLGMLVLAVLPFFLWLGWLFYKIGMLG